MISKNFCFILRSKNSFYKKEILIEMQMVIEEQWWKRWDIFHNYGSPMPSTPRGCFLTQLSVDAPDLAQRRNQSNHSIAVLMCHVSKVRLPTNDDACVTWIKLYPCWGEGKSFLSKRKREEELAKDREIIVDVPLTSPVVSVLSLNPKSSMEPFIPLQEPQDLLTAFDMHVAINEYNGKQRGHRAWELRGIAESTPRESCPLFSPYCQCLLKPTVICEGHRWNGFVNTIFNASLGGDKGSTTVTRETFLTKHTFAIHIIKYLNICYRLNTIVSIMCWLWGWMERKGEEEEGAYWEPVMYQE